MQTNRVLRKDQYAGVAAAPLDHARRGPLPFGAAPRHACALRTRGGDVLPGAAGDAAAILYMLPYSRRRCPSTKPPFRWPSASHPRGYRRARQLAAAPRRVLAGLAPLLTDPGAHRADRDLGFRGQIATRARCRLAQRFDRTLRRLRSVSLSARQWAIPVCGRRSEYAGMNAARARACFSLSACCEHERRQLRVERVLEVDQREPDGAASHVRKRPHLSSCHIEAVRRR